MTASEERMEKIDPDKLQFEIYEVQRKFIKQLALYIKRMQYIVRGLALALIIFLFFTEGWSWALGAFMGALIVEINLSIFFVVVKNSDPRKKGSPIWLTIMKFYLLFAATAVYVFICIYYHIGEPKGFLFGILTFIPALVATIIWAMVSHIARRSSRTVDE
ncbi:MAG: ATP synthase subunit I [Deltaproteobacteria bacterium]|jgi:hypothetical protein|nr:ATP synthase subunit I [Deltaproteobacteria bacterium]